MEIRVMWMISMKCFELDGQSQITNGIKWVVYFEPLALRSIRVRSVFSVGGLGLLKERILYLLSLSGSCVIFSDWANAFALWIRSKRKGNNNQLIAFFQVTYVLYFALSYFALVYSDDRTLNSLALVFPSLQAFIKSCAGFAIVRMSVDMETTELMNKICRMKRLIELLRPSILWDIS
jgi:hypothetical protein